MRRIEEALSFAKISSTPKIRCTSASRTFEHKPRTGPRNPSGARIRRPMRGSFWARKLISLSHLYRHGNNLMPASMRIFTFFHLLSICRSCRSQSRKVLGALDYRGACCRHDCCSRVPAAVRVSVYEETRNPAIARGERRASPGEGVGFS